MLARVAVCEPTQPRPPAPRGRLAGHEGGWLRAAERRGAARRSCHVPSVCHPLPLSRERDSWWAVAQDISESGIGLVLERRFELGTVLVLELESVEGRAAHYLLAEVVRTEPQPGGTWLAGCAFIGGPTDEQIATLV